MPGPQFGCYAQRVRSFAAACTLVALAALPGTARADPEPRFSVMSLGLEGRATRFKTAMGSRAESNWLLPKLSISHYGIDWYMRLDLSWPAAAGLELIARDLMEVTGPEGLWQERWLGRIEIGTHWPQRHFLLATGVYLGGLRLRQSLVQFINEQLPPQARDFGPGFDTPDRTLQGAELGACLRIPFGLFDRLRVDPGLSVGGALLDGGGGSFSGLSAEADLELLLALSESVSLQLGGKLSVVRYAEGESSGAFFFTGGGFSGAIVRISLGVALHDIWGLGSNNFETKPVPGPALPSGAGQEVEVTLAELDERPLPFERAPPLALPALDARLPDFVIARTSSTSSTAAGPLVVVNFGASYCEPCMVELPVYGRLAAAWAKAGVQFLFVTVDEDEQGRAQIRDVTDKLPALRVLSDADQAVASRWQVRNLPQLFLVDGRGRLRWHREGLAPDTLQALDAAIRALLEAGM